MGAELRWRRMGRIFDPAEHLVVAGGVGFAQSPQAVVFDDYVRIFFSTRTADAHGKFVSHVVYADFSKRLDTVLRVAEHPVIAPGGLGCFDEHGIFPLSPFRRGSELWGYTCGWSRRASVSVETAIGLAVSRDGGATFDRVGPGPVLGPSLHEPCLVGDGFVVQIGDELHMWYIFGTGWLRSAAGAEPDRTYKIAHATSSDGVHWTKDGRGQVVPDRLGSDECQALPTVIMIDGRAHMFFCYRQSFDFRANRDRGYRIGHASSDDLVEWHRDDDHPRLEPSSGEWDSDMECYPNVFECDGEIYLLYNGNEFGRHGFGAAVLER